MMLDDSLNLYEVLELSPHASTPEIRAAYLRAKAAYRKDSVALYSLLSGEETEQLLQRIEEAYQTLSHPDKRRDYDRKQGITNLSQSAPSQTLPSPRPLAPVVSIDRVPPMEDFASEDDLLSAPTTDFTAPPVTQASHPSSNPFGQSSVALPPQATAADPFPEPTILKKTSPSAQGQGAAHLTSNISISAPTKREVSPPPPSAAVQSAVAAQAELQAAITQETEWRGGFLRKVREARRVSIEEMADSTKISRSYLVAIEEENFARLPAPVYLRGFLLQYARYLRIPQEAAASAYLARYHQSKGQAQ